MTTNDRWTQLKAIARQQLQTVDKPGFPESFIEYECEPSFHPIFNLQFIWTEKILKWRFAEWDIIVDRSKFFESNGATKVLLHQPEPTIKIQSGTNTADLLTDVVAYTRGLAIKPRMDKLESFTLDGSYHTLSFGTYNLSTIYKWHTLPEEWNELEKLVDMLLEKQKLITQSC